MADQEQKDNACAHAAAVRFALVGSCFRGCGAGPCRESASDVGTETVVEVIDGLWLPRPCAAASFLERLGCF